MQPRDRKEFGILTLGEVMSNLGFGILIPVLPSFAAEIGIGAVGIGAIIAAPSVAKCLVNLPAGLVADRRGRVPVMASGEFLAGVGVLGTALSAGLWSLMPFRLLLGAGSSLSMAGASAYSADITERPHLLPYRGALLGAQAAVVGLAYVVGPALGGVLGDAIGPRGAYVTVGLCTIACAAVWATLPETLPPERRTVTSLHTRAELHRAALEWRVLFRDPRQRAVVLVTAALNSNWSWCVVTVPLQCADWGATPGQIGVLISVAAVLSSGASHLGGKLSDAYGRFRVLVPALWLMAATTFMCGLSQSPAPYVIWYCAWNVAEGMTVPALQAYATDVSPEETKAQAFAMHRMAADLTWALTPLFFGAVCSMGGLAAAALATTAVSVLAALAAPRWAAA